MAHIAHHPVTRHCLIAADIDKTVLAQHPEERRVFLDRMAPELVESARLGMTLAFVTGNSMRQLTDRFVRWLVEHLYESGDLGLLDRFHFFCNAGGVYFRIDDPQTLASVEASARDLFDSITHRDEADTLAIRPDLIDGHYLGVVSIAPADIEPVKQVLAEAALRYRQRLDSGDIDLEPYDLSLLTRDGALVTPTVRDRPVLFGHDAVPQQATVQITLKPVLSFRQARSEEDRVRLFEHDVRSQLIAEIDAELERRGLQRYTARPGGRSSIDVTLRTLDKAFAMEFLIERLGMHGGSDDPAPIGEHAIYFGDEVIVGGGNDYAVTRIPGLLVFAVNPDRALVPFLSQVLVPSPVLEGPDATAEVLSELNDVARTVLRQADDGDADAVFDSAIEAFKVSVFASRVESKVHELRDRGHLSLDDWRLLHAIVTLMHRADPAAGQWRSELIQDLDAVMAYLAHRDAKEQPPMGSSHPDG